MHMGDIAVQSDNDGREVAVPYHCRGAAVGSGMSNGCIANDQESGSDERQSAACLDV